MVDHFEMQTLETYQIYLIYLVSVALGSIANIVYIVLLIVYFRRGCICSTKKGLNILMCLTLIIHNCTLYFPMFLQAIGVSDTQTLTPSPLCKAIASVQNSMKLINCAHFALVFMYTYLVLDHTEFIMNHQKKSFLFFLDFFGLLVF